MKRGGSLLPWLLLSLHALLCSPGLKHHRIQCLPGINIPVKALSGLFLPGAAQLLLQD